MWSVEHIILIRFNSESPFRVSSGLDKNVCILHLLYYGWCARFSWLSLYFVECARFQLNQNQYLPDSSLCAPSGHAPSHDANTISLNNTLYFAEECTLRLNQQRQTQVSPTKADTTHNHSDGIHFSRFAWHKTWQKKWKHLHNRSSHIHENIDRRQTKDRFLFDHRMNGLIDSPLYENADSAGIDRATLHINTWCVRVIGLVILSLGQTNQIICLTFMRILCARALFISIDIFFLCLVSYTFHIEVAYVIHSFSFASIFIYFEYYL